MRGPAETEAIKGDKSNMLGWDEIDRHFSQV